MLQDRSEGNLTISRQQLYEEVWTTPAITLAKRYLVSDVALGKICRKLKIPKPSSGYWAKVAHGKQGKRPPLPPIPAGAPTVVTIRGGAPNKGTAHQNSEAVQQQLLFEQTHPIHVPARLTQYHPLLRNLSMVLKSASKDKYGALESRESNRLNVRVSPKSLPRALRLLSVLLAALEARGFAVSVMNEQRGLQVQIVGQALEFALEERFRQFPREQTANQSPFAYQRYDYEATGQLSLRIKTIWGEGVRKVWRDTTRARLEEQLNDMMVGLVLLAEAQRDQQLERDRRLHEREQERLRQEAEVRRSQEDEQRRRALEREAAQWAQANQIRTYVAAIKAAGEQQGGKPTSENQFGLWLNWATEHADRLDSVPRLLHVLISQNDKDNLDI